MRVPDVNWLIDAKEGENIEFKKAENAFEFYQVFPGLVRTQIQRLLRDLEAQGRIHSHGITRAGHWFPGRMGDDCSKHEETGQ
jgi:hypothetical protein